jgi:hypothetical protein
LPSGESPSEKTRISEPPCNIVREETVAKHANGESEKASEPDSNNTTRTPNSGLRAGSLLSEAGIRQRALRVLALCCFLIAAATLFPPTASGRGFLLNMHVGQSIYWGRLIAEWIVSIAGVCAVTSTWPSSKALFLNVWAWLQRFWSEHAQAIYGLVGIGAVLALIVWAASSGNTPPSTQLKTSSKETLRFWMTGTDRSKLISPTSKETSTKSGRASP